jgi:hypothetical protein
MDSRNAQMAALAGGVAKGQNATRRETLRLRFDKRKDRLAAVSRDVAA